MVRILILCTGNSARSQMAEALLRRDGAGRVEVVSAGSRPAAAVHPLAIAALAEVDIAWEGRVPRGMDGLEHVRWDVVITVCDNAREACPYFPGQPLLVHWGMPDPAEATGSAAERLQVFRVAREVLQRRISALLALPIERLDPAALGEQLTAIGRMP
ncbi:MAG TPA: arsenate reductase ArsC [Gemmatimonadales bacterium]|nr:arsenate reductase ArsC [Gemmatimonadota bacterium]HPF61288.1 arsenate reductase ArsC [Gemmatimonadales bacterium]HRX17540.1 arsenate reductase ArsC [Gemmatimonadales bacterium]